VNTAGALADGRLLLYLAGMKFSIGYFAKPRAPGIPPALLATYTGDFDTVDDARKAAIADADNPKIGAADSISIEPIGERWVKGESLVRTGSGWERRREPE
jgi:hypothetical protein